MQMPAVTDEHRRLQVLEGSWVGEETLSPSPWGPGGPAQGWNTCRVLCEGFWLAQDYEQERDGQVTFRGHGVFGYDAEAREYSWYWVDSMGTVPGAPARGTWNDDVLTFHVRSPRGQGRHTFVFDGRDRYKLTIENSFDDGATWQTFMTAEYRRA